MKVFTKPDTRTSVVELSEREAAQLQELLWDARGAIEASSDSHSDQRLYFARRLDEALGEERRRQLVNWVRTPAPRCSAGYASGKFWRQCTKAEGHEGPHSV